MIGEGHFSSEDKDLFKPLLDSLLQGGDYFMLLPDYASYVECQEKVSEAFRNQDEWTRKSILNTANTGKFSSDRTIKEYASEIWGVEPVKPIKKCDRYPALR